MATREDLDANAEFIRLADKHVEVPAGKNAPWKPSWRRPRVLLLPALSSRGPCPANKLLHTYPPPYIFFHLPSSTLIRFHHFSTFLSVHLIRFFYHHFSKIFAILFSFLLASFISPTTLQNVISSISSLHPFQKNKFCKIYCKKYLSSKKYSNCLKTICPFPGQKIEQQQHHSPPSFHHFYHIFVWGVARLVGFYLQYIKRYTYIIIITYKGINVIIIV